MVSDIDAQTGAPPDALALALLPDPAAAFAENHRLAGRQARPDQFSLSLFEFGPYPALPRGIVRQAQEAARRVALPAPFDLVFDGVEASRVAGGRASPAPNRRRWASYARRWPGLWNIRA